MAEEERKIDLTKYPEGLKELAVKLKLPIPEKETEKREAMVMGLIASLVRQ